MSDDLVSRLKSPEVFISIGGMTSLVAHEAADHIEAQAAEITRLRARIAELEEALEMSEQRFVTLKNAWDKMRKRNVPIYGSAAQEGKP